MSSVFEDQSETQETPERTKMKKSKIEVLLILSFPFRYIKDRLINTNKFVSFYSHTVGETTRLQ